MIWGDIQAVFNQTASGMGAFYGTVENPNLMQAICTALGVSDLPVVRTDTLYSTGGVTGVRFVRSRSVSNLDSGYMALVIVNGAAALVARSERVINVKNYKFFETEKMAFEFVNTMKKRGAMALGSRVQFEALSGEYGAIGGASKTVAYAKFRMATKDLFQANKAVQELTALAQSTATSYYLTQAMATAQAWILDATARHTAARADYVALGGLVV